MIKIHPFQHVLKLKTLLPDKEFLIAGKGPSISRWDNEFLTKYNVIGINHVSERFGTPIVHFTDYEMFMDQQWFPQYVIVSGMLNRNCKTTVNLQSLIEENDTFSNLYNQKRIFTYDITTVDNLNTNLFLCKNKLVFKYASGVLLVQIAMLWGLRRVFTIGIDGGTAYDPNFVSTRGNGLFMNEQISLMHSLTLGKTDIIKL